MDDTQGIARIAGLIGDRARAAILLELMAGRALTASELARAASVTKQTASSHLAKLLDARFVVAEHVGRYRYFRIADHDVASAMEHLIGLAQRGGVAQSGTRQSGAQHIGTRLGGVRSDHAKRIETGPANPMLRKARVCYDHLAGELGVLVLDSLVQQECIVTADDTEDVALTLTPHGARFLHTFGIDVAALGRGRRPLCLPCLDWSVRRPHLAGAVGAAILERCLSSAWARRQKGTRAVIFSAEGERALRRRFRFVAS